MTTKPLQLPELSRILWATRIDAAANRWHINRRVIPTLTTMAETADDARLRAAVTHATAALTHLDTMLESLQAAIDHIAPAAPATDRQTA